MGSYDVIILGGGPGGYLAAERLGHEGRKVLLLEKEKLGGTCLNVGCIPTKTLLNSAKQYLHAREAAKFGVTVEGLGYDWSVMQGWKTEVVDKLRNAIALTEKKLGVEVLPAEGRLLGPGRIEAGGAVHDAPAIIIATGSSPVLPPIPGARDNPRVVDSTGLLSAAEVPRRLCVIGGGVIGIEFAALFAALGTRVEIVEMMDEIIPFMDKEQAPLMRRAMKEVTFRLGCRVERIEGGKVVYRTKEGAEESPFSGEEADLILMAVGRKPNLEGWGAKEAGLDFSPKGITVDDRMRSNLPGIWAVGDVTGRSLLAHSAYRMAEVAVADILARAPGAATGASSTRAASSLRDDDRMRYDAIPWVVYGIPEAAGVGLTEEEAGKRSVAVKKASIPLRVSGRFAAENGFTAPGSLKLIADAASGRILGLHIVGGYASEMIWGAAALIEQELRVVDVRQLVFPHPTVCELIRDAAWAIE
ncbi:MAG TPA: dihydrolipoyl dehydrogenase [Rectinemataceae bacterium]|nr:dihydrolipoyl dehydrogenase [Rectinemataceae bacterium]